MKYLHFTLKCNLCETNMANLSKLASRNDVRLIGAVTAFVGVWLLKNGLRGRGVKQRRPQKPRPEELVQYTISEKGTPKGPKAQINAKFLKQMKFLIGIMIPGFWTKENGFLILIALSLLFRTACDVWMIQSGTLIESAIVAMDRPLFLRRLMTFFAAMPVVSVVNNLLKWSVGELRLRIRTNITHYLYDQYLKRFTYYKMSNLDNRITNADQLLTTDVDKFCETVTELYTNVTKPLMDIALYVYRLTVNLGAETPGMMLLYLVFSGVILTNLRKPTGRMTVQEQKLEGEFRYINSRLITNSEEIAFYQGNNREKLTLMASFNKLTSHLRHFLEFRVLMGVVDNIVAKYIATVVGFYAVSIPFFNKQHHTLGGETVNTKIRFTEYYTNGRMLVKLAEAIGRLVLAGRDMTRLAGLAARVTQLTDVLADLNQGKYNRTMMNNNVSGENDELQLPLIPGAGKIIYQDKMIHFRNVPLVTPNGDILIREMTFEVKSGMNVIVCGPNGCGKSSLFRVLGELWPIFGGELVKPPRGKLFYVPQRPYMTLGTLRDQVIYPHTCDEMLRRGGTDAKLQKFVDLVKLSYLLQRENGWDAVEDWMDVLSGGEKQRIAMARLFYHAPQFAILDECTSAVSVDVEGSMYNYCKEVGISLFTVSHRKSLWVHHDFYLHMDGRGNYTFAAINGDTEEFGS